MYQTIQQGIAIFKASSPDRIYSLCDSITGHTIIGTASEVVPALLAYDKDHGDNTSFGPTNPEDVGAWALIEYAYTLD